MTLTLIVEKTVLTSLHKTRQVTTDYGRELSITCSLPAQNLGNEDKREGNAD